MIKKTKDKAVSKIASDKVLQRNEGSLKLYAKYKKTSDLIDRVDIATGRKVVSHQGVGSTLNFEINHYGIASTASEI